MTNKKLVFLPSGGHPQHGRKVGGLAQLLQTGSAAWDHRQQAADIARERLSGLTISSSLNPGKFQVRVVQKRRIRHLRMQPLLESENKSKQG
jgi:hypothetical protein